MSKKIFTKKMQQGYQCKDEFIEIGSPMLESEVINTTHINLALKSFNRHGLISGATGTGKTKTIQIITEKLSTKGVPVMLMDLKGDLRGGCVFKEITADKNTTDVHLWYF